jgi:hypothetical protein
MQLCGNRYEWVCCLVSAEPGYEVGYLQQVRNARDDSQSTTPAHKDSKGLLSGNFTHTHIAKSHPHR